MQELGGRDTPSLSPDYETQPVLDFSQASLLSFPQTLPVGKEPGPVLTDWGGEGGQYHSQPTPFRGDFSATGPQCPGPCLSYFVLTQDARAPAHVQPVKKVL